MTEDLIKALESAADAARQKATEIEKHYYEVSDLASSLDDIAAALRKVTSDFELKPPFDRVAFEAARDEAIKRAALDLNEIMQGQNKLREAMER